MKFAVLMFSALAMCACGQSEGSKQREQMYADYEDYRRERVAVKVCRSGTIIYRWRDQLWVADRRQYPDAKIAAPIETICS